ncbi:MAG: endonuclease [Flavobacteriales bacterium]
MKRIVLLLVLAFPLFALAQPAPPAGINLEDMRIWLKQNWYDGDFTDLGYNGARSQMYGFVDASGGQIECIYTGFQQSSGFVTFPDPINAEHLVPQSFYGSVSPMRSDIHSIRPSHGSPNSARGNRPYGEVSGSFNYYGIDGGGNYIATSTPPANPDDFSKGNLLEWEPREDKKGDVARQVFYFYTMYPTQAGNISGIGDLNELYQWHLDDPADATEMLRNDRIESVQGNRNPYVDYPGLVYTAWLFTGIPGCTDPAAINYDMAATIDDGSCFFTLAGCTYSTADNYNALATEDDGSCIFNSGVQGCTYPDADNYNPAATIDNGSCTYDPGISGCTYPDAVNYNPNATVDDGACIYDPGVLGCTYPDAVNYNSSATVDDGSCSYPVFILGCTYSNADNYDSNAEVDNGSCLFTLQATCPEDLNSDGVINIQDVLALLGAFGSICD